MKKLLTILGSIGLTSTAAISVVACGTKNRSEVKIDLNTLTLNKESITISEGMTKEDVFQAFLNNNKDVTDLEANVDLTFNEPSYTTPGSLIIKAKANTAYTGSIIITINAIGQTSLNDLHLKTLLSLPITKQQAAFDSFIKLNSEVSDLRDNLEIENFTAPDYNQTGSLEVKAKPNTKYSGTLTITIPELIKTNIARLVTNTIIQGTEKMNKDVAFAAFLEVNNSWTNLNDYVEVDSFAAATYTSNGSLTIKAKANTAYTGSVMVRINAIGQTALTDLHLNLELSEAYTNQDDAFNAFLELNKNVADLRGNVQPGEFVSSSYGTPGSLVINATNSEGKYQGSVTVNFAEIKQTNLNTLNKSAITGSEKMDEDAAFEVFLKNNNSITELKDSVVTSEYSKPTYTTPGSLTITAKLGTKYTGSITIVVTAIGQTALTDLHLNLEVDKVYTKQQEAFDAFIKLNPEVSDLRDNLEIESFTAPSKNSFGELSVKAKPDSKYSGSVKVNLNNIINLDDLSLETNIAVPLESTQEEVFKVFLEKNSDVFKDNLLNLDEVFLETFQAPKYSVNGRLNIVAKLDSQYRGTVELRLRYILTKDNFAAAIKDLSDNDLLQPTVWSGYLTQLGNLAVRFKEFLNWELKEFCDYAKNITTVYVNNWAWNFPNGVTPSIEDLNTPGYVLHLPNFYCNIYLGFSDGPSIAIPGSWNIWWTTRIWQETY